MAIQVEHEIVRHDRITGGKKRDQALDQMALGRRHALRKMAEVDLEIDLFDGPGVLDRGAVHFVELRIAHRAQGEIEAGVEQDWRIVHWHASQLSGFSSEQTTASASLIACAGALVSSVVFAIRVAGRERR